ncbi:ribonuclease Z, chloroplastic [Artemisia annua]|uniref:Ribonuclease Z, chloroplastic n=1 Tax=Artemisia annua TaxID=35608 RepID=A0A2U1M5Z8_ARTAN|nr:ribonuclease Z, chloroplastic [Artemisia annua]
MSVPSQVMYLLCSQEAQEAIYSSKREGEIEKKEEIWCRGLITDIILSPEVAFTGDTTSDFLLDPKKPGCL